MQGPCERATCASRAGSRCYLARKRKRASPCGLTLFEVRSLSRAALLGSTHMIPQPCVVVKPCCAVFWLPTNCRAALLLPSEVALPPWGGRGVGLPFRRCRPVLCRRTKKALDSLAGVWYGKAVGSISLNANLAKYRGGFKTAVERTWPNVENSARQWTIGFA